MGTSGNPAKKAAAKKTASKKTTTRQTSNLTGPSSVQEFKRAREGVLLPLPSGLVVKARRVEMQAYLKQSKGDVFNPLMSLVAETLEKGNNIDLEKALGGEDGQMDVQKLADMYDMVNGMVIEMVVEPPVFPVPEDDEDRDDDLLYVDEVGDEDKMFLFQWGVGGTDDLATFREETREGMAALAEIQGRQRSA
jgi:hypothetical protein